MKILTINQIEENFVIKLLPEEVDADNKVTLVFNDKKFDLIPNSDNEISVDVKTLLFEQAEKNICMFEYNELCKDEGTGKIRTEVKSLVLTETEEDYIPDFKIIKREGYYIKPFFTKKLSFRIGIAENVEFHGTQYLKKLSKKGNVSKLQIALNTETYPITDAKLVLLARENLEETIIDIDKITNISESKLKNKYRFEVEIDWCKYNFEDDTYDAYVEVTYACAQEHPELSKKIRLGKTRYLRRKLVKELYIEQEDKVLGIHPYFTDKYSNISFVVQNIPVEVFNVHRYEKIKQTDVILIGERPYKAQDTGFALFKQLRINHPDLPVYYIIQHDSIEYENVRPYGNTVDFGSVEHARLILQAKTIFCSHSFYYLYPFRNKGFEKKIKARKIFIQHGILGVKNMASLYGFAGLGADQFVVSSEFEKEIVVRNLDYDESEVAITGLSRYDTLLDGKNDVKNQILVIPTWRDWLAGKDKLLESEYYEYYYKIINDETLNSKLEEQNTKLVFCLHPNMQKFTQYFESKFDNVQLVSQGEIDVQVLIKESKMMITDYSSVAFDFSFLGKPVIYFQFDRNRFLGKSGSFIDLDKYLPGEIVFSYDDMIKKACEVIDSNYQVNDEIQKRTKLFLEHNDLNNSERILALSDKKLKTNKIKRWYKQTEFFKVLYNTCRKSKIYFPVVKLIYPLLKLLPIKENYIVFESGVGKQVADAPREIYEQLVATDNGKYKKIWAYNGTKPLNDSNTKVVKRLSLSYYYYLATSKYWVNNQNFPYYVTTRKDTNYLQTWHGTPLKRMFFDLDEFHGRDEGYVKRVTKANSQWTTLLAQSDYAADKFRSAFHFEKEILNVGYPRNDVLFKDTTNQQKILRNSLNIPKDKKVILYAPTFRDDAEKTGNKFNVELKIDFKKFIETLGSDYVLLLRFHVITSNKVKIPIEYQDNIKNVSNYPEIQDLYKISDCLITDYSSVFFDYINLKKPMIFYAYDLEKYENELRGFYLNYKDEVPGPVVYTEEELLEQLSDLEQLKENYAEKIEESIKKYAPYDDANASKRVIDNFFEISKQRRT